MELVEMLKKLVVAEDGADATEYALLAALIAVVIIVGAQPLGNAINNTFNKISNTLNTTVGA